MFLDLPFLWLRFESIDDDDDDDDDDDNEENRVPKPAMGSSTIMSAPAIEAGTR